MSLNYLLKRSSEKDISFNSIELDQFPENVRKDLAISETSFLSKISKLFRDQTGGQLLK